MRGALRTRVTFVLPIVIFAAACGEANSTGDANDAGQAGMAQHASSGGAGGKPTSALGGAQNHGGAGGSSGAAGSLGCTQVIPEGTKFRVTLLGETDRSDQCHIVNLLNHSPFELVAGKAEPPTCEAIPATAAPPQDGAQIISCVPDHSDMLGITCSIEYRGGCRGSLKLAFSTDDATIDWSSPRIDNAIYIVEDFAPSCLPDLANCHDEYSARLERTN